MSISRTDRGDETVLTLSGVLDAATLPLVAALLEAAAVDGRTHTKVHASELRLIDSVGVRALATLARRLADRGTTLVVCGLRGQPLLLFRLLRLDAAADLFSMEPESCPAI